MVQQVKVKCPVCADGEVVAVYYAPTLQIKTSRGSGQSGKITFRTTERYEVMGDCPSCDAKQKAIQQVLDGKLTPAEASSKKKKCKFCGEMFEGTGKMCKQCAEWKSG